MNAPNLLTVHQALDRLRAKDISAQELWQGCLAQVERLNPRLCAFLTLSPEDHDRAGGEPASGDSSGMLAGIPVAVKDLIETAGLRTTAGSLFFKDYVPGKDATVIQKIRLGGGRVLGKTNTHEIALGVTTQNPHFGACRNPWDESRIPGGSSGGSAVAVATGMALAGLGTDTGGSIRIPASLCGIVGLKPTYGRVSLRGVFPLSWNLDHVGPLTTTVEDAALLLQVISGFDPDDPSSVDTKVDDYCSGLTPTIKGWRIALGTGEYIEGATTEVLGAVHRAAVVLGKAGAVVEEVDVSFLREAAAANGIMTQADAAAYHRERLQEHPEWFGEDVRKRLEAGRDTTATAYSLARRTQAEIKRRLAVFFEAFDVLLLPATPSTASRIEGEDAVEKARQLTRFTAPFNLTGLPAISVPCGMSAEGLPIGLQLVAGEWQERRLLQAALTHERGAGSEPARPPMAIT